MKYYRQKYEDLKNSAAFPLTEKTGQEILCLVVEKIFVKKSFNLLQKQYI